MISARERARVAADAAATAAHDAARTLALLDAGLASECGVRLADADDYLATAAELIATARLALADE